MLGQPQVKDQWDDKEWSSKANVKRSEKESNWIGSKRKEQITGERSYTRGNKISLQISV